MTGLIEYIEGVLGKKLETPTHLARALVHSSHANERVDENVKDNERLEFLGDAVLELVISERLIDIFPNQPEGMLTKYRSSLVNEKTLTEVAQKMSIHTYLQLGKGESKHRDDLGPSILSDAVEALFAAVFLSEGFVKTKGFVLSIMGPWIDQVQNKSFQPDYKSELQEYTLKHFKLPPRYKIIEEGGPAHDKVFVSEVSLQKKTLGQGRGKSKKLAEAQAAKIALNVLAHSQD